MLRNYFKLSLKGVTQKGIRSWLTMVGIFIGITAVVALISIGQGFQMAINEQFQMMGTNLIIVMPGGDLTGFATTAAVLTDEDKDVIEKVEWCKKHRDVCIKVGKNAQELFEDSCTPQKLWEWILYNTLEDKWE